MALKCGSLPRSREMCIVGHSFVVTIEYMQVLYSLLNKFSNLCCNSNWCDINKSTATPTNHGTPWHEYSKRRMYGLN